MKTFSRNSLVVSALVILLLAAWGAVPAAAAAVEKDTAAGDEDAYAYGAAADEVLMWVSTATGDVNGDGVADLVIGHDQGGTGFPYLYTGKVNVYYGRAKLDRNIDLGSKADVTINGYYATWTGNDVACGDVNGDGIDDIIIGAYLDSYIGNSAGAAAVVFGSASLPSAWDFNSTPPDAYISSAVAGEMCGMSVAAGDLDGDGYDDVAFGAPLANGGVHFGDGSGWTAQADAGADTLYDVSLHGASGGWAVGKYVSVYTTLYRFDGTSWAVNETGYVDAKKSFYGVHSANSSNAWAVGEGGAIIKWNGSSWGTQTSGVTATLRDVAMSYTAPNHWGWAVGDGGTVVYSANGSTWSAQSSSTTANLRGVSIAGASDAWAVGDGGTIIKWNGSSWGTQTSGVTSALRGVSAVDASNAWAVGDGGVILKWDGSSWGAQTSGVTSALRGVSAVDASNAWAVGDGGVILKTVDGGMNWTRETVSFSQGLHGVDVLDAGHAWTVGEAGTGRAYVAWGRAAGAWPPSDAFSPMPPDMSLNGIDAFDYCGVPVSAGDLDADGYDDLVVASYEASGPGNARKSCGEAYVVRGRPRASFPNALNLATGASTTVYGGSQLDKFPTSVSTPLEDLNGDGKDDLVFGDIFADGPGDARSGCGEVAVIHGGSLPAVFDLATRAPDVLVYGPSEAAGAGRDVSVLDFDADGVADLATAGPNTGKGTERPNCGVAWLAHGSAPWPSSLDLATGAGMVFYGAEQDDAFGICLSSANLDGDAGGFEDLVISDFNGAGPGDARPHCGEHFVFLGYDFVPPTCSITNVADGSVLAGIVGVEVDATDHYGIARVEFRVDGELRFTDTSAPYRWDWDTRQDEDGATYELEARAFDTRGNQASDSRTVTLNNTVPPASRTWYLAEGTTAWGFEEWVLVQNPGADPVGVTYTFMKPGGETQRYDVQIAGNSRFSLLVNSVVESSDVSTRVLATGPVICERAMYYAPPGNDRRVLGHDSIGVTTPSPTWYLAEGTTAWGFEEYVLVQNPETGPVDVTMTFMKPGGATQTIEFPMAGESRHTVTVNQVVPESDVSTRVEATGPVICERAMYRYGKALGHDSIGTPSTSREWYLAEGTTAWGFDEWVLVQNPGTEQAVVGVQFMLPDGTVVPYGIVLPGQSRDSIHVNTVPGCESTDLSTYVSSSVPVICERAMYWQGATSPGGHDTIGTPLPSKQWYLAEGTTAWGFEEYVLVQNPNAEAAVVSFTFMRPDATTEFLSVQVAGNSRYSLFVNGVVPESDASVQILADRPVISERAMYWGDRDLGTATIGVRGE